MLRPWSLTPPDGRSNTRGAHPTRAAADAVQLGTLSTTRALARLHEALVAFRQVRNARRGALTYRPVGAAGEPYPPWVRALKGASGVYVIRDRTTRQVLYVGESHSGALYDTLTRHLQRWGRWKKWWQGQYTHVNNDPGVSYERDSVEVAVRVLSPTRALVEEARLVRTLRPRDNVQHQPPTADGDDAVPF